MVTMTHAVRIAAAAAKVASECNNKVGMIGTDWMSSSWPVISSPLDCTVRGRKGCCAWRSL